MRWQRVWGLRPASSAEPAPRPRSVLSLRQPLGPGEAQGRGQGRGREGGGGARGSSLLLKKGCDLLVGLARMFERRRRVGEPDVNHHSRRGPHSSAATTGVKKHSSTRALQPEELKNHSAPANEAIYDFSVYLRGCAQPHHTPRLVAKPSTFFGPLWSTRRTH